LWPFSNSDSDPRETPSHFRRRSNRHTQGLEALLAQDFAGVRRVEHIYQ
jgi:hypothetical protein